ncbi:hypothetical protein HGM15179_010129 [Zosterops borbonicus]|uniref:Uncharacterized protein n=1 Tax=Zosterops borbonicus TaxID=364589 RepID=A0A8K1GG26_9PASS|nr:hypothetical protein HGM15179_010129 [Zosterops borbonicus]
MLHKSVLALVVLLIFALPLPVDNGLDEDAKMSAEDLEQATPEPAEPAWGLVLEAALQQGPFWATAELLMLPFCFCYRRARAAMRRRAAARRAEAQARRQREMEKRRRRMEIEQRRLRIKRRFRDLKEMWKTMNMIRKNVANLIAIIRKVSRRVKASWAGFWSSTDRGLCEGKLLLEMLLGLAKASRTSL